jgi:hypothetical protein
MAEAAQAPAVKLICGMISAKVELFDEAADKLTGSFGPVDLISEIMDFDFTHYYDKEMGTPLHRKFVAFADCVGGDVLIQAKWTTNAIERDFAEKLDHVPPRPINLDPGYIEPSKLVLSSMKDFSHRIYLGRSVYAEVTLMYRRGKWEPLPWTFPDYASHRYHPFLTQVRQRLQQQLKQESHR